MKRNIIIAGLLAVILILFVLEKNDFNKEKKEFNRRFELEYYFSFFWHDYIQTGECALSIDTLVKKYKREEKAILKYNFWDSFQDNKGRVKYLPIYNSKTNRRDGYIVLSAGIDGNIDTPYGEKDTLYDNSFLDKLRLYNPDNFYKNNDVIKPFKINFNIYSRFFGKKDFLIQYINCAEETKGTRAGYKSIADMYYDKIKKVRAVGTNVKIHNVRFDKNEANSIVEFYDQGSKCNITLVVLRYEPVDSLEGIIVGSVDKFDTINRVIKLRGVFVY